MERSEIPIIQALLQVDFVLGGSLVINFMVLSKTVIQKEMYQAMKITSED